MRLDAAIAEVCCEIRRDLGAVSHAAAADVAVEEIERSPSPQSIGDGENEVISDDD